MGSAGFPFPGLLRQGISKPYPDYFSSFADATAQSDPAQSTSTNRVGPLSSTTPALLGRDAAFAAVAAAMPKRQRVPRACDICRRKKIRCNLTQLPAGEVESDDEEDRMQESKAIPSSEDAPRRKRPVRTCVNCTQAGVPCTFTKSTAKRGPNRGYIQQLETRLAALESSVNTDDKDKSVNLESGETSATANRLLARAGSGEADPVSEHSSAAIASGLVALATQAHLAQDSPLSSFDDMVAMRSASAGSNKPQTVHVGRQSTPPRASVGPGDHKNAKGSQTLSPQRGHRSIYGASFAAESRPPSALGRQMESSAGAATDTRQDLPRKKPRLSNDSFSYRPPHPVTVEAQSPNTVTLGVDESSRLQSRPSAISTSPGHAKRHPVLHHHSSYTNLSRLSAAHQAQPLYQTEASSHKSQHPSPSQTALPPISQMLSGMPSHQALSSHRQDGYSDRRFTEPTRPSAILSMDRQVPQADGTAAGFRNVQTAAGPARAFGDKASWRDDSPIYGARSPPRGQLQSLNDESARHATHRRDRQAAASGYLQPILTRKRSLSPLPERRPHDRVVSRTSGGGEQFKPFHSPAVSRHTQSYTESRTSHDTYALRQRLFATPAVRTFAAIPLKMLEDGFHESQTLLRAANSALKPSSTTSSQQGSDDWVAEVGDIIGHCMRPLMTATATVVNVVPREVEALILCYLDSLRRGRSVSGILGAISGKLTILQSRDVDIKRYNAVLTLLAAWHTAAYLSRKMYPAAPTITDAEVLFEALETDDPVVRAVCHVTYTLDRLCRRYIDSGQRPVSPDKLELAGPSVLSAGISLPPRDLRLLVNFDCMLLQLNFLFNQDTSSYPAFETIAYQERGIRNILDEYESCGAGDILLGPHMLASAALTSVYCVLACTELGGASRPAASSSWSALRDEFASLLDMLQGLLYHLRGGSAGHGPHFASFGDMYSLYEGISRFIRNSLATGVHGQDTGGSAHHLVSAYFQLGYMGLMVTSGADHHTTFS